MQAVHHHTIQSWLITHLAEQLGLSPEDIDVRKPFTEYGLDSMVGVLLAGDLEDWLGLQLSPTVLWDYPTTEALAQYLTAELQRQYAEVKEAEPAYQHASADLPLESAKAKQLLATLDALSDEAVNTLLSTLLATQGIAA